jgi:uncharacterized protein
MHLELDTQIQACYRQIDAETAAFGAAVGLSCPPSCGQCCDNPQVEATPIEMLPAALALARQGSITHWLAAIEAQIGPAYCIFYQPDPADAGRGHCLQYPWRPLICRLFGYAATLDKTGQPALASCRRHQRDRADTLALAQTSISAGLPVPQFASWQARLASLVPVWGQQYLPINQALRIALEQVGLQLSYQRLAEPAKPTSDRTDAASQHRADE